MRKKPEKTRAILLGRAKSLIVRLMIWHGPLRFLQNVCNFQVFLPILLGFALFTEIWK
jgi:hypothetical protein